MKRLESGRSYCLADIFKGDRKIMIPDMQRDYCWAKTIGENTGKSLVEMFLETIINSAEKGEDIRMGIFYAYEYPQDSIQLCDGQQRLTTLYLILAVCYKLGIRNVGLRENDLKDILMSLEEYEKDDHEPRLQYAIRESTLYFLKDLVYEFFFKDSGNWEILSSDWYSMEYNDDPSINNIIEAIKSIHKLLKDKDTGELQKIADFVVDKMWFLFFDMKNRRYGEEQFVLINTTGRNLTATENLKPLYIGEICKSTNYTDTENKDITRYAMMWEEWEDWIWSCRDKKEGALTAEYVVDEQFRNILLWKYIIDNVTEHNLHTDDDSEVRRAINNSILTFKEFDSAADAMAEMDDLSVFIDSIKWLESNEIFKGNDKFTMKGFSRGTKHGIENQIDLLRFLPVLEYVFLQKKKGVEPQVRDVIRIKNFFNARAKSRHDVGRNIAGALPEALLAVKVMIGMNVTDIYSVWKWINEYTVLFPQYLVKFLKAVSLHPEREELENIVWEIEELKSTNGYLGFIQEWLKNDNLSVASLQKIYKILSATIENPSDLLRRAMLAENVNFWRHEGYTDGAARYDYGSSSEHFSNVLLNSDQMKSIIGFLSQLTEDDVNVQLQDKIDNYIATGRVEPWHDSLIRDPKWFNKAQLKRFYEWDSSTKTLGWIEGKDGHSATGKVRKTPRDVRMIVAVGKDGAIGKEGNLIWRIPEDLKRFKMLTMGYPVIMGRKTWESLPKKPLPGRRNIVLTRQEGYEPEGAEVVRSVEEALRITNGEKPFVIGGEEIYKAFLPYSRELYLTVVEATCDEADAFLHLKLDEGWEKTNESELKETETGVQFRYEDWKR